MQICRSGRSGDAQVCRSSDIYVYANSAFAIDDTVVVYSIVNVFAAHYDAE